MDSNRETKRKKDKHSDSDDYKSERRPKRRRSRSRSPNQARDNDSRRKRKHSKSKSPVKQEKRRDDAPNEPDPKSVAPIRKAKETDMLNTRTGGAYIPPARLRMMQAQITDKSSPAYQRLAWEALKKSIHGHINKINVGNIGIIIKQLLKENIVRGRGLLCRSVIQAQAASPTFTNVYAALVAAVNSRFPNIGELLLKRLVIQFKRGFKRNDKPICISSASFIAHLVNQRVAHEILALELLTLLVETPTDDSVEVAIAFLKECGQKLTEVSSKGVNAIFEMLRNILHEGQLDKRVQYMIEVMFQVWKDGFKDHPAVLEELELVPEEDQFTHLLMLDDATDAQDILNVFKFDEKYEENEEKYKALSREILGSDVESGEEGSEESGSEESEDDEEAKEKAVTIIDNTETNLVALRRTIYLTINSSLDFEECAHKLMKMQLKPGQEIELCHMFLDCCAEQRTYEKFYGLLAQRFCNINRIYISPFEEIFKDSYSTAHRLDTNRLRNVSKFFAHLLFTDSISWEVLECVKLNEEDTTSSSRIYIKILFQELAEYMGLKKLNDRLQDPTLQSAFSGIFPRDNPKNTRFSINFFTSIGLGGLTDELREHLKQMPKNVPAPITEIKLDSDSSSDSSSSSSDSSTSSESSSSDSEEDSSKKKKDKNGKKDKRKKSKKTPKTPEIEDSSNKNDKVERWGHDGFYDTYGSDARRNESRNNREETQSSRNNNEERKRYNDSNRSEKDKDRRDDRRKDPQEYRRETERDHRNDSRHQQSNDRRKNNEESDRRHDDRDSTTNRNNHENEDRYNRKDMRNMQERVDDRNNDQLRGRERDHDKLDRRNNDPNYRKERSGHDEREETTSRNDRNDNDRQRKRRERDNDQPEHHVDSRKERNNRDDQNNYDRYNKESGKRYDNRDSRPEISGNTKEYDGNRYENRDNRNNDDRYNKDLRNQNNDDRYNSKDSRKTYRTDEDRTNKYSDNPNRRDGDRNKNSPSSEKQTEKYRNDKHNELNKKNQDNDSRYSKKDETQKKDRRGDKSKNNDSGDDEQNNKNDRIQKGRKGRDDIAVPKKANKEKNNGRRDGSDSKEDSGDDRRVKYKDSDKKSKKDSKKDKSNDKKRDKRKKRKEKENLKDDSDTSDSSDSSESSADSTLKGGRYWDTFDIASKETSTKLVLEERPEKSDKYYERKQKR